MASSESQGKTIALVVFVVLWFSSSVTAYVFWQKYDEANKTADEKSKLLTTATGEVNKVKGQYDALRAKTLVTNEKLDHDQYLERVTGELQKFELPKNPPANIAKAIENINGFNFYSEAIKQSQSLLQVFSDQIAKLDKDKKDLEEQLKAARAQYSAENKKFQDAASASDKDKKQEVARLEDVITQKSVEIEGIQRRLNATIAQLEQMQRDGDRKVAKMSQENQELRDNLDNVKQREEQQKQIKFEKPKGTIVELTEGGKSAVIDKGYADGVQTGLSFGIYGLDRGGNPNELPKAAMEIVRVVDDHRSVGRLSMQQISSPVLPGDLIYNPIWSPGEKEGIAFVGVINLGRSKEDDSDLFRKVVEENGGKIDCYMDMETGQVKGNINVKTQWLVIGDIPEPDPAVSDKFDKKPTELYTKLVRASTTMREMAKRNGVRVINLKNFLTFLGHNNPERTVPAGKEYDLLYKQPPPRLEKKDDSRAPAPTPKRSSESKSGKSSG